MFEAVDVSSDRSRAVFTGQPITGCGRGLVSVKKRPRMRGKAGSRRVQEGWNVHEEPLWCVVGAIDSGNRQRDVFSAGP